MYNGQRTSIEQIGQIKQNKMVAADYSRPRKGSYCQYKQQKYTKDVSPIIPVPPSKEELVSGCTTRRSSLGFYDSRQIKKNDADPRLEKYVSKQMNQNQRNSVQKNDRSFNFIAKNRQKEYEQYLHYDTDRFVENIHKNYAGKQQKPFFPSNQFDHIVMPDRLMKQDSKRLNKYDNYQNKSKYERINERNSYLKKPQTQKIYDDDSFNHKYQEIYDQKRNQKASIYENYGKNEKIYSRNQLTDRQYLPKRQNYIQPERYDDIQSQKQIYQPKKPMEQYKKNANQLYHQRQYGQITHSQDNFLKQAQTPSFNPSHKNYHRQKSIFTQTENFYESKRDNERRGQQNLGISPRYQKSFEQPNNNPRFTNGTPNRQKKVPQQKYEQRNQRNLTNSRKDHLISKSKILRQKMNELSADKKILNSASKNTLLNTQHDQSKNQSHQQRLERLRNSKDRVYESPFKQTTRSTTNIKARYALTNNQNEKNDYPKNQQKIQIKTQENTKSYPFENRQNNKDKVYHVERKGDTSYGPVENDCMNRINILNSKINEKISSIINSYGRPSH